MLQVSLLGQQVIADDASGCRVQSSRSVALAAFLVAHAGTVQPRHRIAGLFWPDSTDAQALTNLRRELHHLRHALADAPVLRSETAGLAWRDVPDVRVDLSAFDREAHAALAADARDDTGAVVRHGTAALAEYRGEFLPGAGEAWVLDVREERERRCAEVCAVLARHRARAGDATGAIEAARRRVRLRPFEEDGHRALMALQAEHGDRSGAVSTYHHCASVLERELGVAPDAETRRLAAALIPPRGTAQPPARPRAAPARLVGRRSELEVLARAWRHAVAGVPGLVLVRGEAGVGKTRLVAELAADVRRSGGVVAAAACFGTGHRLALAPVADWLRAPAVAAATTLLEPVWRVEVERLVPVGPRAGPGDPGPVGPGAGPADPAGDVRTMADAWRRHRFVEGLTHALLGVGRPLLLTLDDLQWSDQETRDFLAHLLGHAGGAPLLVLATLRGGRLDDEPDVTACLGRLRATGALTEVALAPLDAGATARLAAAVTGRATATLDAAALHAATGGLPLHVLEVLRGAPAPDGPPDLAGVLRRRLEQTGPAARGVAALAAAVGREFTPELLVQASDLDAAAVVGALDELWRARIVRETEDGYDFSHALLRDAAAALVSPPTRWLLHRRLAEALERLHAEDTDAVSARLARHHARGGRPERAIDHYRRAAAIAADRFAHTEAIRLLGEALVLVRGLPAGRHRDLRELDVLEALAAPLNARHGYASPVVRTTLESAVALAERWDRRGSLLSGLAGLWASRFVQGDLVAADAVATRALTAVGPDGGLAGPARFAAGGSAFSLGRPREALVHFAVLGAVGGAVSLSVGTRPDLHGTAWAAHAHWLLGHDVEARACARSAVEQARRIDHPYSLGVTLAYAAVTHQLGGDRDALTAAVAELRDLCERHGFAYYREWGLVLDGWCRGDREGVELAGRGVDGLRAAGAFARMPYWLSLVADLAERRGRTDDARATLDAAIVDARARRDLWWLPEVLRRRAALEPPGPARRRLRAAAALARSHGSLALLRRCHADLRARGVDHAGSTRGRAAERNAARTPGADGRGPHPTTEESP